MTLQKHYPAPWVKTEALTTIPIKASNGRTVVAVRYGEDDDTLANAITALPALIELAGEVRRHGNVRLATLAIAALSKVEGR